MIYEWIFILMINKKDPSNGGAGVNVVFYLRLRRNRIFRKVSAKLACLAILPPNFVARWISRTGILVPIGSFTPKRLRRDMRKPPFLIPFTAWEKLRLGATCACEGALLFFFCQLWSYVYVLLLDEPCLSPKMKGKRRTPRNKASSLNVERAILGSCSIQRDFTRFGKYIKINVK